MTNTRIYVKNIARIIYCVPLFKNERAAHMKRHMKRHTPKRGGHPLLAKQSPVVAFQRRYLHNAHADIFLATEELSYECNETNHFYNVEWVYNRANGLLTYQDLCHPDFDKNPNGFNFYHGLYRILHFSNACDEFKYSYTPGAVGKGPQQTHVHVSYNNPIFVHIQQLKIFMEYVNKTWVTKYQAHCLNRFRQDVGQWTNDKEGGCGKKNKFLFDAKKKVSSKLKTKSEAEMWLLSYFKGYLGWHSTPINAFDQHLKESTPTNGFHNQPLRHKMHDNNEENITSNEDDLYQNRYKVLNLIPTFTDYFKAKITQNSIEELQLHLEFRALENLTNWSGDLRTWIGRTFGSLQSYFQQFATYVSKFLKEVFETFNTKVGASYDTVLHYDPNHLRFGVEFETCFNQKKYIAYEKKHVFLSKNELLLRYPLRNRDYRIYVLPSPYPKNHRRLAKASPKRRSSLSSKDTRVAAASPRTRTKKKKHELEVHGESSLRMGNCCGRRKPPPAVVLTPDADSMHASHTSRAILATTTNPMTASSALRDRHASHRVHDGYQQEQSPPAGPIYL